MDAAQPIVRETEEEREVRLTPRRVPALQQPRKIVRDRARRRERLLSETEGEIEAQCLFARKGGEAAATNDRSSR